MQVSMFGYTIEKISNISHNVSSIRQSRMAMFGAAVVIFYIIVAIAAPILAPNPPVNGHWQGNLENALLPPFWYSKGSLAFPLGTDQQGRGILSRIIFGIRLSFIQGVIPVILSGTFGVLLGLSAGLYGGKAETIISMLIDWIMAFPAIVLALVIVAIWGGGLVQVILIIAATQWVLYARTVRAQTYSIKNEEFIQGQKVAGASNFWIMRYGILPNVIPAVIVMATLNLAQVVILAAGLTFLGLGISPPAADIGLMISSGRAHMLTAWWYITFPGLALMILVLGINMLGDGIRDILDPKYM